MARNLEVSYLKHLVPSLDIGKHLVGPSCRQIKTIILIIPKEPFQLSNWNMRDAPRNI